MKVKKEIYLDDYLTYDLWKRILTLNNLLEKILNNFYNLQ